MFRRLFTTILVGSGVVLLLTFIVLRAEGLAVEDAAFSSIALLVQGEPMAMDPKAINTLDKLVIGLAMIGGTLLMALVVAFITDRALALRLDYLLGKRGVPAMNDHIILIGIGTVGYRTWQALRNFPVKVNVVCIERNPENTHLEEIRRAGDTVIVGDPRQEGVLERAGCKTARTVICTTDDDLGNLDFALTARELHAGIRVVLRMYDQRLASRLKQSFDIQVAFSSSSLAAPAFAAAAFDRNIINSYYLGNFLVLTARVGVAEGSEIAKMTSREMERAFHCSLLKRVPKSGEHVLYPQDDMRIEAGDVLMISCTYEQLQNIKVAAGDAST